MNFSRFLTILNPQPKIAGLEINDSELKFVQIKGGGGSADSFSSKFPEGTISGGQIKNRQNLIESLSKLHEAAAGGKKKKICVIVNISDSNVYTQIFNLPSIAESQLEEATKLNMQMISPVDFQNAYSDWQIVNQNRVSGEQLEVLAAFIQKQIIGELDKTLRESGFIPAAFEFNGLSLARLAIELGADVDVKKTHFLLYVGSEGLSFNLIKNGNLYSNRFISWQSVYSDQRQVSFDSFRKFLIEEVKRMVDFYSVHLNSRIDDFLFALTGLETEIVKIIGDNFSFPIKLLALKQFKNLSQPWFPALGSAVRGMMPRSKDNFISLASVGTEKEFHQQRIVGFARLWRNAVITTLAAILLMFVLADGFLIKTGDSLSSRLANLALYRREEAVELENFESTIEEYNQKIGAALKYNKEKSRWSLFFEKIKELSGSEIVLNRIYIQSPEMPILINGRAVSESAALNFKERLENSGDFQEVDLPITGISPAASGVDFSLKFKLR